MWFDAYDDEATVEQLEVLAEMEDVEIDDLLDERLSTKAVLYRLNHNSGLIPHEIIAAKRAVPRVPRTSLYAATTGRTVNARVP